MFFIQQPPSDLRGLAPFGAVKWSAMFLLGLFGSFIIYTRMEFFPSFGSMVMYCIIKGGVWMCQIITLLSQDDWHFHHTWESLTSQERIATSETRLQYTLQVLVRAPWFLASFGGARSTARRAARGQEWLLREAFDLPCRHTMVRHNISRCKALWRNI